MHSCIVTLYREYNDISESDLFERLQGSGVDYVDEINYPDDAYELLKDLGTVDIKSNTFTPNHSKIEEHLKKRYNSFLAKIKDLSFDDYAGEYSSYLLSEAISEKLDVMYYLEDCGLFSFTDLLRYFFHYEKSSSTPWKIGRLFDYHF